jgi:Protein of unknown function (DUF3667)
LQNRCAKPFCLRYAPAMTGELEAMGEAVTGGLLARAVEPQAGEGVQGDARSCLNCGATLQGNHCHQCGQKATLHRTLSAFGHDILHSVLHFDGKIWRTLPLLILHPGKLTRRYIHGERAKFVSPIALFLFLVFLTFAVFNWFGKGELDLNTNTPVSAEQAAKELATDRAELVTGIAELERGRREAQAERLPVGWIDGEIARNHALLKTLDSKTAPDVSKHAIAERKFAIQTRQIEAEIARLEAAVSAARKAGQPTAEIENDLAGTRLARKMMGRATDVLQKNVNTNWNFTDLDFWGSKALNDAAKHATENPQLLIYKVQSNAYKFSWALIPISVPFVWLLFFWRRELKLFDHAVFVTYSLCFMMLLGVVGGVILTYSSEGSFIFVVTILILCFFPPIHMYRQLHHAYQTSRLGALTRTFVLSNFALLALCLFVALIFTLGVTG